MNALENLVGKPEPSCSNCIANSACLNSALMNFIAYLYIQIPDVNVYGKQMQKFNLSNSATVIDRTQYLKQIGLKTNLRQKQQQRSRHAENRHPHIYLKAVIFFAPFKYNQRQIDQHKETQYQHTRELC